MKQEGGWQEIALGMCLREQQGQLSPCLGQGTAQRRVIAKWDCVLGWGPRTEEPDGQLEGDNLTTGPEHEWGAMGRAVLVLPASHLGPRVAALLTITLLL